MHVVILGYGSPDRGDDAAGLLVAKHLRSHLPAGADIRSIASDGTALLAAWQNAGAAIVIDAVVSGAQPGTIHRLASWRSLPQSFRFASSHSFGLAEAVQLAETLQILPPHLVIYGIEAGQFELGRGLSPQVESALPELCRRIQLEYGALTSAAATVSPGKS
ncbi:MAG: hydrogenase maturation protease [Bryobacteraceae bacterium]|nr:hydrogenase maturation protease [Bryobacteraceae bacterium]MDW8379771.1 hydrogenase maturation protease [Bryobacterales bacterium]